MRLTSIIAACAALTTTLVDARDLAHVRNRNTERIEKKAKEIEARKPHHPPGGWPPGGPGGPGGNGSWPIIPESPKTWKYRVDGKRIPDVDFDVGESYAGLMPISDNPDASELYFWFFPSDNPLASDEILIWLNGGPGCSSLEGLLQENGPFLWQYGTFLPVANTYTWRNLTNIVWVEQPAGTGFSQVKGDPAPQNEFEVAEQFLGFWKNFVDTFDLHGRRIFITGESYAGYYVPYIADAMYNTSDTNYYNVESTMIYDPSTTYLIVQNDIPVVPFLDYWAPLLSLNQTFSDQMHELAESCGYNAFMEQAMTFPPTGPLPTPPNVDYANETCAIYNSITDALPLVNPCWDVYQVATTCPNLWDVLGYPGSFPYVPAGADVYFNRSDVQRAINAPQMQWMECANNVLSNDTSAPSGLSVLPSVIEKNKKTVIAHGYLDMVLILNGTIMMIQNMTWNGAQGFSVPPSDWPEFYVPYHIDYEVGDTAGAGVFGNWHTERGLTFCTVDLSGHMIPQYAPSASYRHLEFLLDRISNLSEVSDFTTQSGDFGNNATVLLP